MKIKLTQMTFQIKVFFFIYLKKNVHCKIILNFYSFTKQTLQTVFNQKLNLLFQFQFCRVNLVGVTFYTISVGRASTNAVH